MSKSAALAAVLALAVAVPSAAAYDLPADLIGVSYDLPDELLAFIAATPSSKDFAVGSGKLSKTQQGVADQFNFSARGTPSDATGHVRFNSSTFAETRGTVDCLFVFGNRAAVAGTFDDPPNELFPFFVIAVVDNGEPGSSPDQALLNMFDVHPGNADCGLFILETVVAPTIAQGNIVVKDRP
jgi:hypothetical protein